MFDIDAMNEEEAFSVIEVLWYNAMLTKNVKEANYWVLFDRENIQNSYYPDQD